MNYEVKRIDPYWHPHPMVPTSVAVGIALGLAGYRLGKPVLAGAGAVVAGISIVWATKPALSILAAAFGFLGAVLSFGLVPSPTIALLSLPWRGVAALGFTLSYMVLTDAVFLVVSALYNFVAGVTGFEGLRLELDVRADAAQDEEE